MKYLQRLVLALLVFVCAAPAFAEKPADAEYLALVEQAQKQAKQNEPGFDFDKLRWLYTKTSFYNAYGAEAYKEELFKNFDAYKADQNSEAKENIEKLVREHYGHYKLHSYVGGFAQNFAPAQSFINFDEHANALRALYASMIKDADGESAATAYKVIDVSEEYFMVRYLTKTKGKVESQSLQNENGHAYDVLKYTNQETGEPGEYWFNIDVPMAAYDIPGENPPSPAIPPQ